MLHGFLKYYLPYKRVLILTLLGSVATSIMELLFPMFLRHIMNDILPKGDIAALLEAAVVLFTGYVTVCIVNYKVMQQGRTIGALVEQDMRRALFAHVQRMSFGYFDNQRVGQLVSRIVNDVGEIRELIFLGPNYLLVCIIFMLGTMSILLYLNWPLALIVNFLLLLKAWDSVTTNRRLKQAGRAARIEVGNLTAQTTESLNAIRLVQSFNNEELECARLERIAAQLLAARKKNFGILSHSNTGMVFFSNIINLVIVIAGGIMITCGRMYFSDLVAFMLYVSIFVRPVLRLNALAEVYQKGVTSYQRFDELMRLKPDIVDAPEAADAGVLKGDIVFDDVTFGYNGKQPVLRNFSLHIRAGESVAFVGGTGVGKSTLCNLLPRFYELQGGRILIDGQDIRQLTLKSLRQNIGIVQQDIFLFADTVLNNILYGRPQASQQEAERAAVLAEADRFIELLPQKYATQLGERGVKLSGGQKQRLAIARVFLKNPPILILDEATSSLDNETEKNIQLALDALAHNRTTLVVAHRLASIRNVDRIVVLCPQGIAEQGSHDELMAKRGEYYRLYMTQFEEKE